MAKPIEKQNPDPGEPADAYDQLDWDRAVHGKMVDYATDDEPATREWTQDEVDEIRNGRT